MSDNKSFSDYLSTLRVDSKGGVNLNKIPNDADHDFISKEEGLELLDDNQEELALLQSKLYAHNRHSLLIIVQAMDAAGKDGAIKEVAGGFNPIGLKVTSFKTPTSEELEHDYLWRHVKALPPRGDVGVWNRSHYENVLVTRVHPEYLLNENLPGIESVKDVKDDFWKTRFKQINHFEKSLFENGTIILKFFLHISQKEQKKRFLERIDNPAKNWKFSLQDLEERKLWPEYMKAYEELLEATSQDYAPWFILPADDKWFTRVCMNAIILQEFNKLKIDFPETPAALKKELEEARKQLTEEK
jgi:PPK2 family polyphosphate:nucleotide phosphotransferase